MKSLEKIVKKDDIRLAGVDVSSKKIAMAVVSRRGGEWFLHATAAIAIPDDMREKVEVMNVAVPKVLKEFEVDKVVVEQSIYIQNAKTSRLLSYIIGALYSICLRENKPISDVLPMQWKNYIGYKRIMPEEKQRWIEEMGKTKANKHLSIERKARTKRLLEEKIDVVANIDDDDIVDAIGISIWGLNNVA